MMSIRFSGIQHTHRMLLLRIFQSLRKVGPLSLELFKLVRLPNRIKWSLLEPLVTNIPFLAALL